MGKPIVWTALDICNRALLRIGQGKVTDISATASTTAGQYCYEFYDVCRYNLLSRHPWKFATVTSVLRLSVEEDGVWSFVYVLPPDCIRALQVSQDPSIQFEVKGSRVYCNAEDATLTYVMDEDEPGNFDPLFSDCLSKYLAAELAMPLAGLAALQDKMAQLAEVAFRAAATADAKGGGRDIVVADTTIANSRF